MEPEFEAIESMRMKKARKWTKVLKWIKAGDKGEVKRTPSGQIAPVKRNYRRLPIETPKGRDSKLKEF